VERFNVSGVGGSLGQWQLMNSQDAAAPGREDRFEFGKNWQRFLRVVDLNRIAEAERSLRDMLGRESLAGLTFLDVGCGSGLFSLAAARIGAERVHSFDYDAESVACTMELRKRYVPDTRIWSVERGNVLDQSYLAGLGAWDIVYSWGVLHHTGNMWQALANVASLVDSGGMLYVAIYNDQGRKSALALSVKRLYNQGWWQRGLVSALGLSYFLLGGVLKDLLRGRSPLRRYTEYSSARGMSAVHDWVDWLGGYPFEVARPESILDFYVGRGFVLEAMTTMGGRNGCNQFVFRRVGLS